MNREIKLGFLFVCLVLLVSVFSFSTFYLVNSESHEGALMFSKISEEEVDLGISDALLKKIKKDKNKDLERLEDDLFLFEESLVVSNSIKLSSNCSGSDINQDGEVGLLDLGLFGDAYGEENCSLINNWCGCADINQDGEVGLLDLGLFGDAYGSKVELGTFAEISPAKHRWNKDASVSYSTDRVFEDGFQGELLHKMTNTKSTVYMNALSGDGLTKQQFLDMLASGSVDLGFYNTYTSSSSAENYLAGSKLQISRLENEYGQVISQQSYSSGIQTYKNYTQDFVLGGRNSWKNDYLYELPDTDHYAGFNSTARNEGSDNGALFDEAVANGGWFREFDHWHSRRSNFFASPWYNWNYSLGQINYTANRDNVYYGTPSDILEYLFLSTYINITNPECKGDELWFNTTVNLPERFNVSQLNTPTTLVFTKNNSMCNFSIDSNLAVEINGQRVPIEIINDTSFWFEIGSEDSDIRIYDSNSSKLIDLSKPEIIGFNTTGDFIEFSTNKKTDYIIYYSDSDDADIYGDMFGIDELRENSSIKTFKVLARGDFDRKISHLIEVPEVDYEGFNVSEIKQMYIAVTDKDGQSGFYGFDFNWSSEESCSGGSDINQDGSVDAGDLAMLAAHYGSTNSSEENNWFDCSDVNKDGVVNAGDLALLASDYGK